MITQAQVDWLNSVRWAYRMRSEKNQTDLGNWQAQEYYSPKEWHARATFKVGKNCISVDVREPEGKPEFYEIEVPYVAINGVMQFFRGSTDDFHKVHPMVDDFLLKVGYMIDTGKSEYSCRQEKALELAREKFGDAFGYAIEKQKVNFPIKVKIYLEPKDKKTISADLWVYENYSTLICLMPEGEADDYETDLIKEVLKYRALKHKLSTT